MAAHDSFSPGGDGRHSTVTAIHGIVERCRAGEYPRLIGRMRSGWAVMAERQVLEGYCLMLPDPVVPHLNSLADAARALFLSDMAQLGDLLLVATGALRINYAMFGNVEPALHAHLIPRYAHEPPASRMLQPWALDWEAAPGYAETVHGDLRRRIAAHIDAGAGR